MIKFHIITIFPEMFSSYIHESILGRAIKNKKIKITFYNPRDFVKNNNKKDTGYRPVDDKPYGGGPGMVMRPEPVIAAVKKALSSCGHAQVLGSPRSKERGQTIRKTTARRALIINFVPSANKFTTGLAKTFSKKYTDIILICGRYEGIDARVDKILKTKKISIGDYVLTGGELPALVLIDCVSRQIPGVLGKYESLEEERVSSSEVYTRPEILKYPFGKTQGKKTKNYRVPPVLLSGDHKKIEEWKKRV